ncbi:MAG: hypothetical protein RSE19_06440 [Myroides sp.]
MSKKNNDLLIEIIAKKNNEILELKSKLETILAKNSNKEKATLIVKIMENLETKNKILELENKKLQDKINDFIKIEQAKNKIDSFLVEISKKEKRHLI